MIALVAFKFIVFAVLVLLLAEHQLAFLFLFVCLPGYFVGPILDTRIWHTNELPPERRKRHAVY